jgi:hypothetical protein
MQGSVVQYIEAYSPLRYRSAILFAPLEKVTEEAVVRYDCNGIKPSEIEYLCDQVVDDRLAPDIEESFRQIFRERLHPRREARAKQDRVHMSLIPSSGSAKYASAHARLGCGFLYRSGSRRQNHAEVSSHEGVRDPPSPRLSLLP